jgi:S-formylglutathione hydrolase
MKFPLSFSLSLSLSLSHTIDSRLGGCQIEGDSEKWDFGEGAGYYVDATENKWAKNYRMFSYVNDEFYQLITKNFNVDPQRIGIFGFRRMSINWDKQRIVLDTVWEVMALWSVSSNALANTNLSRLWHRSATRQIANGESTRSENSSAKVRMSSSIIFVFLLMDRFLDEQQWKQYDACELVTAYQGVKPHAPILIDQGTDDQFKEKYLLPEKFVEACQKSSFPVELRMQKGYDHSYYFIMTFLEDHFKYHQQEFHH